MAVMIDSNFLSRMFKLLFLNRNREQFVTGKAVGINAVTTVMKAFTDNHNNDSDFAFTA